MSGAGATGRLVRLAEKGRARLAFRFDGVPLEGCAGDTVLTAILMARPALRQAEFGPEARAGFCLMGACEDCWLWQEAGPRLRACATPLAAGMALCSTPPARWPEAGA